jgi:hypothetical protein
LLVVSGVRVLHIAVGYGEALCGQYNQLGFPLRLVDFPAVPVCSWCRGALR